MEECYKALSDQLDWNNPEGNRCPFDLSKPLPLKGHPCHLTGAGFCGREWGEVMGSRESGGEAAGSRDEGLVRLAGKTSGE
nr:hypothetical protein [Tanacetum cinerariifolium]